MFEAHKYPHLGIFCYTFHIFCPIIISPDESRGIYWIQVRRAAAAAAVEISLWTR